MALTLFPRYSGPGRALFPRAGYTLPPLPSEPTVMGPGGGAGEALERREVVLTQASPHLPPPAARLLAPKLRPESFLLLHPRRCCVPGALLPSEPGSHRPGTAHEHMRPHTHSQLRGSGTSSAEGGTHSFTLPGRAGPFLAHRAGKRGARGEMGREETAAL